jgi:ferritin-like metal-binding protein YciE
MTGAITMPAFSSVRAPESLQTPAQTRTLPFSLRYLEKSTAEIRKKMQCLLLKRRIRRGVPQVFLLTHGCIAEEQRSKSMSMFTSVELNSLKDLFVNQIEDLFDAENRLTKALPKVAEAAHSNQLRQAIQSHLAETQGHVSRLEAIFRELNIEPKRETCEAMKGLLDEGEEMIGAKGDPEVKDAALIAAAQRVEHYEISGYGTARTFAQRLGLTQAANLLQQTLNEEVAADKKLTTIAESSVNAQAATSAR